MQAKVCILHTVPYTTDEASQLPEERQRQIREYKDEKMVHEEEIIVTGNDIEDLRRNVLQLCDVCNPKPIVVMTDAAPHSFLVGKQYYIFDDNGFFECIAFKYNPDHLTEIARAAASTRDESGQRQAHFIPSQQQRDEIHQMMMDELAKRFGLKSFDEYIKTMKEDLIEAHNQQADNSTNSNNDSYPPKQASQIAYEKMMERLYEHGGKGAYCTLQNPKQDLYKTTILFRVIGKSYQRLSDFEGYYLRLKNIQCASICNANDGSAWSLTFDKRG